jgi:hypothetical protein
MSNKQMTAVQEAIDLIKQDYEANGRLRLAFVLQTLNKAKEKEKQQIKNAISIGLDEGCVYANNGLNKFGSGEQYYNETYGGQNNE